MVKTRQIIVKGKVQGVWFRQSARVMATELEIAGSVENLQDGSVKIIAEGRELQMQKFVDWCRSGPPGADVQALEVTEIETKNYKNFKVL